MYFKQPQKLVSTQHALIFLVYIYINIYMRIYIYMRKKKYRLRKAQILCTLVVNISPVKASSEQSYAN